LGLSHRVSGKNIPTASTIESWILSIGGMIEFPLIPMWEDLKTKEITQWGVSLEDLFLITASYSSWLGRPNLGFVPKVLKGVISSDDVSEFKRYLRKSILLKGLIKTKTFKLIRPMKTSRLTFKRKGFKGRSSTI